jgi:hypothetical protein
MAALIAREQRLYGHAQQRDLPAMLTLNRLDRRAKAAGAA